ncbi:MAG: hypothetical protein ACRDRZ_00320 [Pseudonocardiaceae bacterium]
MACHDLQDKILSAKAEEIAAFSPPHRVLEHCGHLLGIDADQIGRGLSLTEPVMVTVVVVMEQR